MKENNMVKYDFLKSNHDWDSVLTDSRASVNKEALNKEPSTTFKKKILLAEHSVIRDIIIRWKWIEMPYYIAMHWVRHVFQKVVSTQRNDRQDKYDRKKAFQDVPVTFTGTANTQNLIDAFRKRLCRQALAETREYAVDFKARLHDIEPEISEVLVPHCVYRGQCQEINNCGWYEAFLARHPEIDVHTSLQQRYDIYNKEFYEKHSYIVETENNENG